MIANYHTHTYLCHHASGEMEDYVKTGIDRGLKILGFSDHVPIPFHNGFVSRCRMSVEETKLYADTVLSLKEKYKDHIQILLGFEAEYYPREFEGMMRLLTSFPTDYLILGQHFTNNEYDGRGNMGLTTAKDLENLVDTYITAMDLGVYSYIAHPDLLPYDGEFYDEQIRRMLRHCVLTNTPVEYNILGMADGRFYPHPRFWELVKEEGASVVIGCDAHQVNAVCNPETVSRAEREVASYGLQPLPTINLKTVKL
ncbi:MAG: histidinol-phosphatase [Lachnospiraceae bacterium]|nr:histidinol-phosphatase [Lachnospiraceae bacterium]